MFKKILTLTLASLIFIAHGMQPMLPVAPLTHTHICLAPGYSPVKIFSQTGTQYAYLKGEKSEPVYDLRAYPRSCPKKKEINRLVYTSIQVQDPTAIREYFSNWHGNFSPLMYAREMAEALVALAHQPHSTVTHSSIAYLLHELHPEHIRVLVDRMDCIFDAAMDNGHHELIRFIDQTFEFRFAQWALFDAIESNNPKRVEALMKSGISANKGLGTQDQEQDIVHDGGPQFNVYPSVYAHYPLHLAVHRGFRKIVVLLLQHGAQTVRFDHHGNVPLDLATFALVKKGDAATTQNRLAIIRRILESMPPGKRPLAYHLNMCHIPKEVRTQLRDTYNAFHIPGRVCMTDEVEEQAQILSQMPPVTKQPQKLESDYTATKIGLTGLCTTALLCCYKAFFHKADEPKKKIPKARSIVGGKNIHRKPYKK